VELNQSLLELLEPDLVLHRGDLWRMRRQ
jgi:hypothetical protein